jgi:hypothetical protein
MPQPQIALQAHDNFAVEFFRVPSLTGVVRAVAIYAPTFGMPRFRDGGFGRPKG